MKLFERRNGYALYCYGVHGWALFCETKFNKDGEQSCIVNGKWSDVWPKYKELIR